MERAYWRPLRRQGQLLPVNNRLGLEQEAAAKEKIEQYQAGGDADDEEEFGTISSGSMELEQWLENNEDIFYLLVIYTSGQAWTLVQQFATEASGKDAWEALVEKYEGAGNLGAVDLSRQLLLYKISETADPDIAFAEIEGSAEETDSLRSTVHRWYAQDDDPDEAST